jgi:thioesterase domain-containing protein
LFLVHGFAGGVTGYARLAKLLGSDQPLYGLQARGIDGKREPHTRIEDMAWDYIQEMRAVQPGGPYFLGGYCFGGLVAYEMACQLRAQGETVGLVAILEGYAPRAAEKGAEIPAGRKLINFLQNLPSFFKEFLALSQNEKASLFRVRFSRMKKSLKRKAGLSVEYEPEDFIAEDITQVEPHLRQVMMNHIEAARMYRPCKYPGRIDLFRVRRLSLFRATDPLMGWGTLAAEGIEVHRIEGAHRNILQPPQVETLAIQLRACLEGECAEK